jgi:AcrR family transcriptional regulator
MARPPKEDWVPLMRQTAVRRLKEGRDVKVMDIAEELGTSPALVHFYFGDRQHLIDEAWREILWAFVEDDAGDVARFAEDRDWDGVAMLVHEILSEERDATHSAHVRAAGEAVASPDLRATLREVHEATIERWADLLRTTIAAGRAETPLDLDALATLLVAVPIGLAAVDPDMEPSRRRAVADAYLTMLRSVLDARYSPHAAGHASAAVQG